MVDDPHDRHGPQFEGAKRSRPNAPSEWQRDIYRHRDLIEASIRGIHGGSELCGYTTAQLMGLPLYDGALVARAHAHLVNHWAPKHMWGDPVC